MAVRSVISNIAIVESAFLYQKEKYRLWESLELPM